MVYWRSLLSLTMSGLPFLFKTTLVRHFEIWCDVPLGLYTSRPTSSTWAQVMLASLLEVPVVPHDVVDIVDNQQSR